MPARRSHREVVHSLIPHTYSAHLLLLNKLHGSSSAVVTKSIEEYREVLDAASANVVGHYPPEDECWDYKETRTQQKSLGTWCYETHTNCRLSQKKFNHYKSFCEFYDFDPELDETSEGIAFDAKDFTNIIVDCTICHDHKCAKLDFMEK